MADIRKSRFTEAQIVGFIKQAEAGLPIKELCRKGMRAHNFAVNQALRTKSRKAGHLKGWAPQ